MTYLDALPDLSGRTFVLTGATSGIGEVAAAVLAKRGGRVLIGARSLTRGESTASRIRKAGGAEVAVHELDLARLATVRSFAEEVLAAAPRINALCLNAGLVSHEERMTEDGFELQLQSNHLGHFLLTHLLLDRLRASAPARVVVTASIAHREVAQVHLGERGGYHGMRVYAETKLANVLFTRELARRLQGTGVTANCLHPGTVATGWGREAGRLMRLGLRIANPAFVTPARAAATLVHLAVAPEVEGQTGGYWVRSKRGVPSKAARDAEAARRLWHDSARLLGLDDG